MNPGPGELWEFIERKQVAVGNNIATYLISAPALVINRVPSHNGNETYAYMILWGSKLEYYSTLEKNRSFGERIS